MVEVKLCPGCPYAGFVGLVKSSLVKERPTAGKLCQKMRAFAKAHDLELEDCPFFAESNEGNIIS